MKKQKAFTIIEAMAALLIASGALFLAARMQMGSFNRIVMWRDEVDRIYLVKKYLLSFFITPPRKPNEKKVERLENPLVTITTQYGEIPKKSSLFPLHERLRRVESIGEWSNGPLGRADKYSIRMITFVAMEPPAEKK